MNLKCLALGGYVWCATLVENLSNFSRSRHCVARWAWDAPSRLHFHSLPSSSCRDAGRAAWSGRSASLPGRIASWPGSACGARRGSASSTRPGSWPAGQPAAGRRRVEEFPRQPDARKCAASLPLAWTDTDEVLGEISITVHQLCVNGPSILWKPNVRFRLQMWGHYCWVLDGCHFSRG